MLIKATEADRKTILNYCSKEPGINLFIIGDIERYGFENDFQDLWIQQTSGRLCGIILRYYQNFILYSQEAMQFDEILELMSLYKVDLISGKASVLMPLYPRIENAYTFKRLHFAELDSTEYLETNLESVTLATVDDAEAIAHAYAHIEAFEHLYPGGFDIRVKQISNRIQSGEGRHLFIRSEGQIISHANTAAETSRGAMIGGVMTLEGYRRNHYAKTVVSALCTALVNDGKKACLFYTGDISAHMFHAMGFKDIDNWIILGGKKYE